jgi:hypothetical protein
MNRKIDPILELANTYAQFFIKDFAVNVMGHLRGSHSIPQDVLTSLIETEVSTKIATESLSIGNTSTVGRFLYECAQFAVENNIENAESRDVWDQVSALPSIHHAELSNITYGSADLYRTTVDQTVIGTIGKNADTTARLIQQAAQARSSNTETGGSFNLFSWGILNDGMWLNAALNRANDRAGIFKADHVPTVGWANQAFNFAHQAASFKTLDESARLNAQAEITFLLGQAPEGEVSQLLGSFTEAQLNSFLFSSGQQRQHINHWDKSRNDPKAMMANVADMSTVMKLLEHLQAATQVRQDDMAISDQTVERISQAVEAVTMSLVGYEAMRETRFASTLIMGVAAEGADPKVDVFVNADNIANYRASSGTDAELVQFGLHLDPRAGMPASANGWSLQYVLDRRENVIPQVMAEDSNRLQRLRDNDAAVIRQEAGRITRDAVQSVLSARNVDTIPLALNQTISKFSQELTNGKSEIRMDQELISMLAQASGDSFVQKATDVFVNHLNAESEFSQHARAATVASLAIGDAFNYITAADLSHA